MVIKKKPETHEPGRAHAALLKWQNKAHRPDDVRRHGPQHLALHKRFSHQTKFVMFEITQTAMNELCGGRRGAGSKIVHFRKRNGITPADSVTRDAAAVDAAADHENIVDCLVRHGPSRAFIDALLIDILKARTSNLKTKRLSNEIPGRFGSRLPNLGFNQPDVMIGTDGSNRIDRTMIGNEGVHL